MDLFDILIELPEVQALKEVHQHPSKWHELDLAFDHTAEVMKQARGMYPGSTIYLVSAALHDIGKALTVELKKDHVTFYKHDAHSYAMARPILKSLIKQDLIPTWMEDDILFIIDHHMRPLGNDVEWTLRATRRFRDRMNTRMELLMQFSDLDVRGTRPSKIKDTMWVEEIIQLREALVKLEQFERRHPKLSSKEDCVDVVG